MSPGCTLSNTVNGLQGDDSSRLTLGVDRRGFGLRIRSRRNVGVGPLSRSIYEFLSCYEVFFFFFFLELRKLRKSESGTPAVTQQIEVPNFLDECFGSSLVWVGPPPYSVRSVSLSLFVLSLYPFTRVLFTSREIFCCFFGFGNLPFTYVSLTPSESFCLGCRSVP